LDIKGIHQHICYEKNVNTKEYWNKKHAPYSKGKLPNRKLLSIITKHIDVNENVLNIGCSKGNLCNYFLSSCGSRAYGIDISSKAIFLARKNYPRINFKIASIDKIPFDTNFFSLVVSIETLEHSNDIFSAVCELIRVLKDDGKIVLIVPNKAPNKKHNWIFTEKGILNLFKHTGMKVKTSIIKNRDGVGKWILAVIH